MNPEEMVFLRAAFEGDVQALTVLADWYCDKDDRAGECGARWAYAHAKRPYDYYKNGTCLVWYVDFITEHKSVYNQGASQANGVPEEVLKLIPNKNPWEGDVLREVYDTRHGRFFQNLPQGDSPDRDRFVSHPGISFDELLWITYRQLFHAVHMLENGL